MDTNRLSLYVKEVRERQVPYNITYLWNIKYGTNEPVYEADSQT